MTITPFTFPWGAAVISLFLFCVLVCVVFPMMSDWRRIISRRDDGTSGMPDDWRNNDFEEDDNDVT